MFSLTHLKSSVWCFWYNIERTHLDSGSLKKSELKKCTTKDWIMLYFQDTGLLQPKSGARLWCSKIFIPGNNVSVLLQNENSLPANVLDINKDFASWVKRPSLHCSLKMNFFYKKHFIKWAFFHCSWTFISFVGDPAYINTLFSAMKVSNLIGGSEYCQE